MNGKREKQPLEQCRKQDRTQRINYYVSMLKRSQPEVLENGLKTMYLRSLAQELDNSVLENDITMQEIVTDNVA